MSTNRIQDKLGNPNLNLVSLADGSVINQRVADLIEVIMDRWQGRVEVRWRPTRQLKGVEAQFLLVECLPDGKEEPIFWVQDEEHFTGEVLERLIAADNSVENALDKLDAKNAAIEAVSKKLVQDQMDEAGDIFKHVMESPLNTYRVDKNIIIKDHGDRTR